MAAGGPPFGLRLAAEGQGQYQGLPAENNNNNDNNDNGFITERDLEHLGGLNISALGNENMTKNRQEELKEAAKIYADAEQKLAALRLANPEVEIPDLDTLIYLRELAIAESVSKLAKNETKNGPPAYKNYRAYNQVAANARHAGYLKDFLAKIGIENKALRKAIRDAMPYRENFEASLEKKRNMNWAKTRAQLEAEGYVSPRVAGTKRKNYHSPNKAPKKSPQKKYYDPAGGRNNGKTRRRRN